MYLKKTFHANSKFPAEETLFIASKTTANSK